MTHMMFALEKLDQDRSMAAAQARQAADNLQSAIDVLERTRDAAQSRVDELRAMITAHERVVEECSLAISKLRPPDLHGPGLCRCDQPGPHRAGDGHVCGLHVAMTGYCAICGNRA